MAHVDERMMYKIGRWLRGAGVLPYPNYPLLRSYAF